MNCENCKYKAIKSDGHCYMFKEKPIGRCAQFSGKNVNVGTIGHIDHGKTTLTAALASVIRAGMRDI